MAGFGYSSSEQSPEAVGTWTEGQQQIWQQLQQMLQSGAASYTPYTGAMTSEITPEEQSYQDWVASSAASRQSALENILSGNPSYDLSDQAAENLASANKAAYVREFQQTTLPGIQEQYTGPGYWGSARARAASTATEDLATKVAQERANLLYDVDVRKQALAESAAQRQAQYGPTAIAAESGVQQSAAELAKTRADEQVAGQLQQWLMQQNFNNPYIQLMFQALGLTPISIGTSGTSSGFDVSVTGTGGTGGS